MHHGITKTLREQAVLVNGIRQTGTGGGTGLAPKYARLLAPGADNGGGIEMRLGGHLSPQRPTPDRTNISNLALVR